MRSFCKAPSRNKTSRQAFLHKRAENNRHRRMKIAYILNSFPNVSTTFIINEIIAVQKRDVDVDVFVFIHPREKVIHPNVREIKHVYYFQSRRYFKIIWSHVYWFFHNPRRYILAGRLALRPGNELFKLFLTSLSYVRMVAARRPDILHAHFGTRPADFCMLVKLLTGIPYTFTSHRYDIFDTPPRNYALKSRMAIRHITISEYNKRHLVTRFGVDEGKVSVIHCGIDFERPLPVSACNGQNTILSVARLEKHKGLDILVKACAELHGQQIPFQCMIIGEGPEHPALDLLIRRLGLSDFIRLLGNRHHDDVFTFLSTAKVCVLPSRSEGIPLSLMEAMACRVPVIGTNVTGNPELIEDGRNGYLVEPQNPTVLAGRIHRLFHDEALRTRFITEAFTKVRTHFNLQTETEKLLAIWRQAPGKETRV